MGIRITPGMRLAEHRDGFVCIGCRKCSHEREMPAGALARIIGWNARIAAAIPRMRCSACGTHGAQVSIFYPRRPRGWGKNPS